MLKKRIIATLVVRQGIVVQSIGFRSYLPVGRPEIAVEFLNDWGVDEIVLIDISATIESRGPDMAMVGRVAKRCRVPLLVGGGIRTLAHARELVHSGADKVAFNQASLHAPDLLTQVANVLGNQCVVGAIDGLRTTSGYKVYDYVLGQKTSEAPTDFAQAMVRLGCGEIFIQSVDRDGSRQGFDLPLIQAVREAVDVPVICCGGAGGAAHFVEVFEGTDVHAASAANFFHYTEHSVTVAKAALLRAGIMVRNDTHTNYLENPLGKNGRLEKKLDQALEEMLFIRIEKEVI
jgi:cyclase